jgi:hypothetical protein
MGSNFQELGNWSLKERKNMGEAVRKKASGIGSSQCSPTCFFLIG